MNTNPRRFTLMGLALSGLAAITLVVILLIKGLITAGLYQPANSIVFDRAIWISVGVFILGLALTAFIDPKQTRKFLLGRQVQNGSNAVIMFLAFLGIIFFLNLLAFQNPKSWDVTENQKNTLAPETILMLNSLPQPISARAYYSTRIDPGQAQKLMDNFKQYGNGKFTFEFIDPETNPVMAKQDGIDRDGTIVLNMADHKEIVSFADEESLDVAIIKLINPEKRIVYFLTGHGETDIEQVSDATYSLVRTSLENKNYTVKTLNLGSSEQVPQDANVIIVAGPQTPLSINEAKAIQKYLNDGGAAIVMENPRSLTKFADTPDPLAALLGTWGVSFQNVIVYDPNAVPPLNVYADPLNYGNHPITNNLRGVNSRFFTTQAIFLAQQTPGIILTSLAQTYGNSWGETNFASIENSQVSFDPQKDIPGPLILAASAENTTTKGRLVVFGDSEFAVNGLYKLGNGDILLNSVDWASRQEKLISLTPKNNTVRTYSPPGSFGLIGMTLISLCLLPLLIIAGGLSTWFSRRKKG